MRILRLFFLLATLIVYKAAVAIDESSFELPGLKKSVEASEKVAYFLDLCSQEAIFAIQRESPGTRHIADATLRDIERDCRQNISNFSNKELKLTVKQLQAMAKKGDADAQFELGALYVAGLGVKQDYETAVKWYKKSAELNNLYAVYGMALAYDHGQGVKYDFNKAIDLYRRAANAGVAAAQYDLASFYYEGRGELHDYYEAAKWFERAAIQEYAEAQFFLGYMYEEGLGVPQSNAQAIKWYELASEQGSDNADMELNRIYQEKKNFPQSIISTDVNCGDQIVADIIGQIIFDQVEPKLVRFSSEFGPQRYQEGLELFQFGLGNIRTLLDHGSKKQCQATLLIKHEPTFYREAHEILARPRIGNTMDINNYDIHMKVTPNLDAAAQEMGFSLVPDGVTMEISYAIQMTDDMQSVYVTKESNPNLSSWVLRLLTPEILKRYRQSLGL